MSLDPLNIGSAAEGTVTARYEVRFGLDPLNIGSAAEGNGLPVDRSCLSSLDPLNIGSAAEVKASYGKVHPVWS